MKFALFLSLFIASQALQKPKEQQLSNKVQQLVDWSNKRSVVHMNNEKFKQYLQQSPRNYSVIAMFTALRPERQCSVCKQASDEFTIVANSWRFSGPPSNGLFFVMIDFDECQECFSLMKLNSAPVFIHFPEKGKPKKADTMDIHRNGFQAEQIGRWINERTDISFRIIRPPNYLGTIGFGFVGALVLGLVYLRRNNLDFLYNKTSWGIGALLIIFTMTSGQMWNHIRSPPMMQRTQHGVSYIHGSSQGQFILETYLVLSINAGVVVGMILLNDAPKWKDGSKKRGIAMVGIGVVALFFSFLLSVFRAKYGGYPYSFLIK